MRFKSIISVKRRTQIGTFFPEFQIFPVLLDKHIEHFRIFLCNFWGKHIKYFRILGIFPFLFEFHNGRCHDLASPNPNISGYTILSLVVYTAAAGGTRIAIIWASLEDSIRLSFITLHCTHFIVAKKTLHAYKTSSAWSYIFLYYSIYYLLERKR